MDEIERLIGEEELGSAQAELNKIGDKNARWHFLQGRIYLAKKWYSEARKQFKIAVKKADADELAEYTAALNDLEEFCKTPEYKQYKKQHMGDGFGEAFCVSCCDGCTMCPF